MAANTGRTDEFCAALFQETPIEFRLLAACCIWPVSAGESQVRGLIDTRQVDWNRLLALGERHRVSGFLANALRLQLGVPEEISQVLKNRAAQIERANLLQLAVAVKATRALEQRQIPFVIMKGAPLAQALFGNVLVRQSKDIDLLVNKDHLSSAQSSLLSAGFCAAPGLGSNLTPRQARDWEQHRKHYDYKHIATGVQVELHWRAFDNSRLGSVTVERADLVECSPGQYLPAPGREEMFPLLIAHGAGHAWFRLKWLVDVAAMLAQAGAEEQSNFSRSIQELGLGRPAEQAQLLCASLFRDTRIATPKESTIVGRWLAEVARDALQENVTAKSAAAEFVPKRLWLARRLLRRGWVYQWEETTVYAASPADWKALKLPDWLQFAYPVFRVPLWLWRRWSVSRRP